MARPGDAKTVIGTRIKSDGNMDKPGSSDRFETVAIPYSFSLEMSLNQISHECKISDYFGTPLIVIWNRRRKDSKSSNKDGEEQQELTARMKRSTLSDRTNLLASLLMINPDMNSRDVDAFGEVPAEWSSNTIGDAIVIRDDGKPVTPRFLEAFCSWLRHEIQPSMQFAKHKIMFIMMNSLAQFRNSTDEGYKATRGWDAAGKAMVIQEEVWKEMREDKFKAWCRRTGITVD